MAKKDPLTREQLDDQTWRFPEAGLTVSAENEDVAYARAHEIWKLQQVRKSGQRA